MRTEKKLTFTARTRTGKAITCAVVVAFTAAFYLMYLTAVLVVRQTLLLAVLESRSQTAAALVLGFAFDFVALGILWRYLTPPKVFRFLHTGAEEIASPYIRAWRRGRRLLPLSPVFALILIAAVSVAVLRRIERYNVRPRPAPAADAMIREAIANGQLLMSTSPCNESNDHSPMADGK